MKKTLIYCDRCGSPYEQDIWPTIQTVNFPSGQTIEMRYLGSHRNKEEVDLCPDCRVSFQRWFGHPDDPKEEGMN